MLTLRMIRDKSPCDDGWTKLLKHLGKSRADDEPLDLLTVLDSNGLLDALWVLDRTGCDPRLARHFAAWCAEQVLPLFERERPSDTRPRDAIAVARDDNATDEDRAAAGAAARDAAGAAARAAAWAAAGAAAWATRATGTAWDAAGAAAWATRATGTAWDAAGAAAWAARATGTAWDDAWAAAWAAQSAQLRKMLVEGF